MNPFDALQASMEGVVKTTFGYDATWQPSGASPGDPVYSARVLFKEPTAKSDLDGMIFMPTNYLIEYFVGDFPGLFELARDLSNADQVIIINGINYGVRSINKTYDGKTYKVIAEKLA